MWHSPGVRVSRRRDSAGFALLVLVGTAALTLAGCAVAGGSGGGTASAAGTAKRPAQTVSARSVASTVSPAALSPKQRAQVDAVATLADFAVPPGAKRLSTPPASVGSELNQPPQEPGTPYLVDEHSLWEAPGAPTAVLAWEEQHVPRQFTRNETFGPVGKVPATGAVFELPSIVNVLNSRQLLVEVVNAGSGQTAIRVDAQDAWTPPKPAGAVVPSAATAVTLSLRVNSVRPPAPVTITALATVRKLAALIDGVPPNPGEIYSCPPSTTADLYLTFRARPGGPVLATADLQLYGCDWVALTVGKRSYLLGDPGAAYAIAPEALKVADLHWTYPPITD
jgi:hypothetical protein